MLSFESGASGATRAVRDGSGVGHRRLKGVERRRQLEHARERSRARFADAWLSAVRQMELARKREQLKKQKLVEKELAWTEFIRTERREIKLRQDGQLAALLGKPLPGELPEMLRRLASHDQTQAERGLVALMSGGNTVYKALEDLDPDDMPARIAANRLRISWLKERRDQWRGRGETPQ